MRGGGAPFSLEHHSKSLGIYPSLPNSTVTLPSALMMRRFFVRFLLTRVPFGMCSHGVDVEDLCRPGVV